MAFLARAVVLCALIFFTFVQPSFAAIRFVQVNSAVPQTPQTVVTVPYRVAQVAGDLNVVVVGWNDSSAAVTSVTDSMGNVYARAVGPTSVPGYASQSIYYAKNIRTATAGGNVVTVRFSSAAIYPDIRIAEYGGVDTVSPVDVTAAATGNSLTSSCGPAATSNANDLIVAANLVLTSTTGSGSGFTSRVITYPDGDIVEDRIVTATGSYSASAPLSYSGRWVMQMVAFKSASTTPPAGSPDLSIGKTHVGAFARGQRGAAYTVTVGNSGTAPTSGTVTVTEILPVGLSAVALSGTGWSCTVGALTCTTTASLAPGSSYPPITVTVNVATDAPATITNAATVSGGGDSSPGNNTASDATTVTSPISGPTVTVEQAELQRDPTNLSPINFTATFSAPVTGLASSGIIVGGSASGTRSVVVTGSGTTYNLAVSGMTNGTVTASVAANAARDASGRGNSASTSSDNGVTYDTVSPAVTINQAATQPDPTTGSPVNFTALFSEAVTGFGSSGVAISGTAGGNKSVVVTGSGTTYNVSVGGMTSGTLVASVAANAARDAAGNPSSPSTSTDNSVTYSGATAPTPVAAYPFDEGAGTTASDASGNGNNGAIAGAKWTTAGRNGTALSFDGNSYVNLGNNASLRGTGSMTWSAWIYATGNPPDDGQIVAKGNDSAGWQLKTTPDTGVRTFGVGISPDSSSLVQRHSKTVPALQTWYHVAGVYNAAVRTLDIYVNGELDNGSLRGTVPASQYDSPESVTIGRRSGGYYFQGIIDELRIYKMALTPAQIKADMTTPVRPPGPGTPNLAISNTHVGDFTAGQSGASYTITVSNVGTGSSSGMVTVTDTLPAAGLTATALAGSGWSCTLLPLACTRSDSLAAGATYPSIRLVVNVAADAPASVTNSATVSGGGDTTPANNSAGSVTVIAGGDLDPDLAITKTHAGNFTAGQSGALYTITTRNAGGAATSGMVTVTDTLPAAGLTATALSGPGWSCTLAPLACTRSDGLAAGASYPPIMLTVKVADDAPSTVTNTATVVGGGDLSPGNNTASSVTVIGSGAGSGPAYPLKPSINRRFLVDQNDVPFLLTGDSPQALMVNASEAEAETYFANRKGAGFNALWINLLCNTGTSGRANGSTYDGIVPFTTAGDLTKPNEAYFARADHMIRLAAKYGHTVILDPIETIGWLTVLRSNGVTAAHAYGEYLGNRYKEFDNIIWMSGNDLQSWKNASDDELVLAVARGIKEADTRHIHTVELNYNLSASLDDPNWAPIIELDAAYTYYPTYVQVLNEYNRSNYLPVFLVEANYEFERVAAIDYGTPAVLRRQEYWTMLSGGAGHLYASSYTWRISPGWLNNLNTPGAAQVGYLKRLLQPLRWYDLVPDQDHRLVTAGYGTFTGSGSIASNDFATAARTADGALAVIYMPTRRSITVDMANFSGAATARWYDPTNGTYTAVTGSPFANSGSRQFTPPGGNSAGDGDWVLVLEVK